MTNRQWAFVQIGMIVALFGLSAEGQATRPAPTRYERFQAVFRIQPQHDGVQKYIENVLSGPPESYDAALTSLVTALNSGVQASEFRDHVLQQITPDTVFINDKNWKYGQWGERSALAGFLYSEAKKVAKSDPPRAAEMAKAAVLLAACDDFVGTPTAFRIVGMKDFKRLANLDEESSVQLDALVESEQSADDRFRAGGADLKVFQSIDVLINSFPEKIKQADADAALATIKGLFGQLDDHPEHQHLFCSALCDLSSLFRERGTADQQRSLVSFIKTLRSGTDSVVFQRWLDFAINFQGPQPTVPRVAYVK
jgi:hypothetical protein